MSTPKLFPFWWLIPPECYQRFVNGGFETGDFTGWELYPSSAYGQQVCALCARSAAAGCLLPTLGGGLKQTFSPKPYGGNIEKFEFWFRSRYGNGVTLNIRVYYTDGQYTFWAPYSGETTAWRNVNLLGKLDKTKHVDYIVVWFAAYVGDDDDVCLDDFTLIECI